MQLRQIFIQYEIENHLNHEQMIEKIGVSRSTYFRWLSGESTKLKLSTIEKVNKSLDIDLEELLCESTRYKPILGQVKAGYDLYADQNIEGYVEVGKEDAHLGDYFLRIVGDSMIEDHILEGDLVYVKQTSYVSSGKIAIILIGDEVTIKRVFYKDDCLVLKASNPKYGVKFFSKEEIAILPVKIIGEVKIIKRIFN